MERTLASPLDIEIAAFRERLLTWFATAKRDLPWRKDRTLYKVVVSEFMLQQTQVRTATPYFEAWIARWPDFPSLAQATEEEVLKAWEGLGYYNRARNLHALAKALVQRATPPQTVADWRTLPGVGPYTAAAITSLAFGVPAAVVDGNVIRILTRLTANDHLYRSNTEAVQALDDLAALLLDQQHPGEYNEALMELGATVCFRTRPSCTICPILAHCKAGRQGDADRYPQIRRKEILQVHNRRAWLVCEGKLLLHKTPRQSKRLANLHELPLADHLAIDLPESAIIGRKKRSITHHRITETLYRLVPGPSVMERANHQPNLIWVPLTALNDVAFSGPHRKWIRELAKLIATESVSDKDSTLA